MCAAVSDPRFFEISPGVFANRLLVGMWQVSSPSWAKYEENKAIDEMIKYVEKGYKTFDMADHYGPAEDWYGKFRTRWEQVKGTPLKEGEAFGFTKWVPSGVITDGASEKTLTLQLVEQNMKISLKRMKVNTLDMVQFHWWTYSNPNYITALKHMKTLQERGLLKYIALTNFDSERLEEICKAGIPIVTNQVQFSIVDNRPEKKMKEICKKYNVKLLTYGTFCGGLLSEKFIGANPVTNTPSQSKYLNMIKAWGTWELFQKLLKALDEIAKKHKVSIANVAVRYVLDKEYVGGVIVGARLGVSEHMEENNKVFEFSLDEEDYKKIQVIQSQSRDLMTVIGDCGDEYR